MHNRNTLRQISLILYKLKRQFGVSAILRRPQTLTVNPRTGVQSVSWESITIKRMIILPRREVNDFVYDLSFIAANKNFTYGAYFNQHDRWMIIDTRDLPAAYKGPNQTQEITTKCSIVIDTKSYEIYEAVLAEHNRGYLIRARAIVGSDSIV